MSEPYVGEIRIFAGNFAPRGWALCEGQLLAVSSNDALFSLLGTTYGGDGRTTFGLPDLRGRLPIHGGAGPGLSPRTIGQKLGTETVALTANEMPGHQHALAAATATGNQSSPGGQLPAQSSQVMIYIEAAADGAMAAGAIETTGGGQPHNNLMPALCVNYIIALYGLYPSRQ
jgi:microcystin-dependent protein